MKKIYTKGQKFGKWTLTSFLGGGGNGEVWNCQSDSGDNKAIKLLKSVSKKSYSRFVDETFILEQNSDIVGIIPIVDKHLPLLLNGDTTFYVMPVAESAEIKIKGKSIIEKIDAILEVAQTLRYLHKREIAHRDIKPGNILYYNGRFSLTDFGLVDYPNKKDVSFRNEEIGPKWTMAPEMRRESSLANVFKADVYSLAKTLWIFLTEKHKGFDGQYSTDSIIELKEFYPSNYTAPIDNLLIKCTDNDPTKRPSVEDLINELNNWKELEKDFHKRNLQQWFEIQSKLFPLTLPQRVIWENINDIVKVLKVVCSYDNLNHVFYPDGGGLDLEDVRLSFEEGCIELDFQLIDIVKPKRLVFESFGYDADWNYFRLETEGLQPSKFKDGERQKNYKGDHEEVSELSPGQYYPYYILDDRDNYEDQYPITDFSRHVNRWFRGSFVIFSKRSVYNQTSSTYDGRHNKMNTDEFRSYIQKNVDNLKQKKTF